MPSYKVLKNIAHNLGHSFLSLMNYRADDYVVEHIFRTVRAANAPHVRIDVLKATIEPPALRSEIIQEAAVDARAWFEDLAVSQGSSLDYIRSVEIRIDFDFGATQMDQHVPELELAAYDCVVEIVDNRGKSHIGKVPEWWRYG